MRCLSMAVVVCLFANTFAQNAPLSFRYFSQTPDNLAVRAISQEKINQLDKTISPKKTNSFPVIARTIATDIDLIAQSESRMIDGQLVSAGSTHRIFFYHLKAAAAKGVIAYFDKFRLSEGSSLSIYSPDRKQVYRYLPRKNEQDFFTANIINGEEVIFEYIAGENAQNDRLHIHEVGYVFNPLTKPKSSSRDFDDSGSCEVNVNCVEGENWQAEKRAVVRILVKSGSDVGWCTGTLLNNTSRDCSPYLLTADHCQIGGWGTYASDADFNQWQFNFNYEAPTCSNPTSEGSLDAQILTGATRIAYSNDNGGDSGSDFLLIKLKNRPDTIYNTYFAGWDATTDIPQYGVGIHHPAADIKKISTYNDAATSSSYGGNIDDTHWSVNWVTTENGHGVTEGGSSGSALFNEYGLQVGTLTGGSSSCSQQNGTDEYGKIIYHWESNGATANRQLKPWLDPENTGALFQLGSNTCGTNTAIENIKAKAWNVAIMPNPTQGIFHIQCSEAVKQTLIYDINGRLLKTVDNATTINILDFPKGIYIAKITTARGTAQRKVVVE